MCNAGGTFIKRIVGLPGEKRSMRNGSVSVNGVPLVEPYLRPGYRGRASGDWARASEGDFVLGGNRTMSRASRRWGVVPRDNIIGRAEVTYWPPNRLGKP